MKVAIENLSSVGMHLESLRRAVEELASFLPSQGPLEAFIHHNPLHAFEDRAFEDAVEEAGELYGCEVYLSPEQYREELRSGRISESQLASVIRAEVDDLDPDFTLEGLTRFDLRWALARYGIPPARPEEISWLLAESDVLTRWRSENSKRSQEPERLENDPPKGLWDLCLKRIKQLETNGRDQKPGPWSWRDSYDPILEKGEEDIHKAGYPLLIRFVSAYLDQGLAHWSMPGRERGLYPCFLELYGSWTSVFLGRWGGTLRKLILEDKRLGRSAEESLLHSLFELGMEDSKQWMSFLRIRSLKLKGWAGMVRYFEKHPDRVPAYSVPAKLVEFLAIQLLIERSYLTRTLKSIGLPPPLADFVQAKMSEPKNSCSLADHQLERAWNLFHLFQVCGKDARTVRSYSVASIQAFEQEIEKFGDIEQRRVLHLAYELNFRERVYDALSSAEPSPASSDPDFQAIFCIDDREESIRRHLEEVVSSCETFGAAGFFNVPIFYKGDHDAHPRRLCPASVQPRHLIREENRSVDQRPRWSRALAHGLSQIDKNLHIGSRTLMRGTVLMAIFGGLWTIPLVLRVLFPGIHHRLFRKKSLGKIHVATSLKMERTDDVPEIGEFSGFTVDEMATIVRSLLEPLGITRSMAELIFVIGHGSSSLNNPHESAHDCGACGGGRGGPNARIFAQMANHPDVRARLKDLGFALPPSTWFVGGLRNTANNEVEMFDEADIPPHLAEKMRRAKDAFRIASLREAHERSRRFDSFSSKFSVLAAFRHVQARANDLAQPRPEYGHASNAFAVIGRRSRTRGLFLDRRAFLVSYDPTVDSDGSLLDELISSLVPVMAGISLEYFFGYIDPVGYGCGTKLPHNVASLLGVMDGDQSDLRTGLPWQMLEIHEPFRLSLLVESSREVMERILNTNVAFGKLVQNRWVFLALLDPQSHRVFEYRNGQFALQETKEKIPAVPGHSLDHYHGRRDHLPFVRIQPQVRSSAGESRRP